MMRNGAYVKAIELVNKALSSGDISSGLTGRAMLIRAQSHEKLGKVAYALADYDQALWIKGISAEDRASAEKGRARIESRLGIAEARETPASRSSEPKKPVTRLQQTAPVSAPKKRRSASEWKTSVKKQPRKRRPTRRRNVARVKKTQEKKEDGITTFFGNLFGSSESKKPSRRTAVTATQVQRTRPASPVTRAKKRTRQASRSATRPAPSATTENKFAIQFAALFEEPKALAEVNRIERKFSADLDGRSPSVLIVPTKDGGTLYKIVAGPFSKGESIAKCEFLKMKKINCMVINYKQ
jgi:hypothetical protein